MAPTYCCRAGMLKKMRKEPLSFVLQSKGLGKRGQEHGEDVQAVDELDALGNGLAEQFGPVDDL